MVRSRILLAAMLSLWLAGLSGCAQYTSRNAVMSEEKDIASMTCSGRQLDPSRQMPPTLYEEMVDCADKNEYRKAAFWYLISGTWSWYDATIIDTRYARAEHGRLSQQYLKRLSTERQQKLWQTLRQMMNNATEQKRICQRIAATGGPGYQPDYMLKNTVQSRTLPERRADLLQQAMQYYLHCPAGITITQPAG